MLLPQIVELLASIEGELKVARDRVSGLEESKAALEGLRDRFNNPQEEGAQSNLRELPVNWREVGITEGAERLIKEFGPMDTREIADQLRLRGVRTKSANFIPTVYASLRESPRVVRLEGERKWDISANHPQLLAAKRLRQKAPVVAKKAKGKGAKR